MNIPKMKHIRLNQYFATAICGNDILSSALYVSGIAILFAGVYAPLVLLFIAFILFLYKKVYTEVVEALPINGGAYNCLLNGTSKTVAAIAGVMTFLSYIATAVISAKVGIEYLHTIAHNILIIPGTIALLFIFVLLVISGIKDSAKVALGIFVFHVFILVTFIILGLFYYFNNGTILFHFNLVHTGEIFFRQGGFWPAMYLAFSASLLGVSGFESSANFVEEQESGVFRKTLRNMLIGVAVFNPLIALVVLNSLPFDAIASAKDFLLADAAQALGGTIFKYAVVIDAFLVLSGAVLTSFVGVSGLVHRMAGDACLPSFFLKSNSRGSFPRIVIVFFILCSSILITTKGNLLSLAGVYTIAFLGVMSLFAVGNLILKETRTELKRTYSAPIPIVVIAFLATFFGILGNIRIDEQNLRFFEIYFIPSIVLVLIIVYQDYIFKFLLRVTRQLLKVHEGVLAQFEDLTEGRFVAFIRNPDRLFKILEYIYRNETGLNITLVYCDEGSREDEENFNKIKASLPVLKEAGVYSQFNLNLVRKQESFGPDIIDKVSREFGVRKNRILIGSIHEHHPFEYYELGGARIIF